MEIVKQEAILTTSIHIPVKIANLSLISRNRLYQIKLSGNLTHQHSITIYNTKLSHTTLLLQDIHTTISNSWFENSCVQVKNTNTEQDVRHTLYFSMISTAVTNTQISDLMWSHACISCSDCEVHLNHVRLINNTGELLHGLMRFDRSKITIKESVFSNNKGGVLFASHHSMLDVFSSTFYQNTAKSKGGVMYFNTDVKVSIASSEFVENTARVNGGVVYGEDNIFLDVFRSNFSGNKGLSSSWQMRGGVACLKNNVTITIVSCRFTDNNAKWRGGVVVAWGGATVRMDSCSFTSNSAGKDGGVVYAEQGVTLRIDSCSFTENSANKGGVVHEDQGTTVRIDLCYFTGNHATWGGVVSVYREATVRIDFCSFTGNSAAEGGVVYAGVNIIVRIESCSFTGNIAGFNGGVVYAEDNIFLVVSRSNFSANEGHSKDWVRLNRAVGGGVAFLNNDVSVRIDACHFTENSAAGTVEFCLLGEMSLSE